MMKRLIKRELVMSLRLIDHTVFIMVVVGCFVLVDFFVCVVV